MTEPSLIDAPVVDIGEWSGFQRLTAPGPAGPLSFRLGGAPDGELVLLNHSILTSSAIWARTAARLVEAGYRVACLDTRGHGHSPASPAPYGIDQLAVDNVAVLDALQVGRAHFVGVSLGGMTGFAMGLAHADRLLSLCICAARADAPAPFAAAWDDRIALAGREGVEPLAQLTAERWLGEAFLRAEPETAAALLDCIRETSAEGFIGCARAIQGLDYLDRLSAIRTPTALLIGSRDESLLQPMKDLAPLIPDARLSVIEDAGHLPQLDQPEAFEQRLMEHLKRD